MLLLALLVLGDSVVCHLLPVRTRSHLERVGFPNGGSGGLGSSFVGRGGVLGTLLSLLDRHLLRLPFLLPLRGRLGELLLLLFALLLELALLLSDFGGGLRLGGLLLGESLGGRLCLLFRGSLNGIAGGLLGLGLGLPGALGGNGSILGRGGGGVGLLAGLGVPAPEFDCGSLVVGGGVARKLVRGFLLAGRGSGLLPPPLLVRAGLLLSHLDMGLFRDIFLFLVFLLLAALHAHVGHGGPADGQCPDNCVTAVYRDQGDRGAGRGSSKGRTEDATATGSHQCNIYNSNQCIHLLLHCNTAL